MHATVLNHKAALGKLETEIQHSWKCDKSKTQIWVKHRFKRKEKGRVDSAHPCWHCALLTEKQTCVTTEHSIQGCNLGKHSSCNPHCSHHQAETIDTEPCSFLLTLSQSLLPKLHLHTVSYNQEAMCHKQACAFPKKTCPHHSSQKKK